MQACSVVLRPASVLSFGVGCYVLSGNDFAAVVNLLHDAFAICAASVGYSNSLGRSRMA